MRRVGVIRAGALAALVGAALSCGSYDPNATTTLYLPDYEIYKTQLHPYLNRQCGTLDCHGQEGRPFRNYGVRGLRLFDKEARLVPGSQDTVEEEYRASYESIIGLEPEATRRVVACEQDPGTLLIYRKPTGTSPDLGTGIEGESHKGGQVTDGDGPGANCIFAWPERPLQRVAHLPGNGRLCERSRLALTRLNVPT